MSEELNTEAGVTTPAPEAAPAATSEIANATPVTPAAEAQPEVPAVAPEQVQVPAAAEPAPVEAEAPAAPAEAPAETAEAPAAPEVPAFVVTEEMTTKATEAIKNTGRSSIPFIQRTLGLTEQSQTLAVIDKLVELKVLGDYKDPRNKMTPRVILIEGAKVLEKKEKPAIKITVNPRPKTNKVVRPKITDFDRVESWKKHLREIGGYTDDAFIDAMAQFALKNQGFNPQAKWGSCLVVMVNRFATKLRDALRTFTWSDSEYMMRELLRFSSEQPLGDGPIAWNTKFTSNMEQKTAVSEFFGINCSFREMRGKQCSCMTAVRDAAWPTREEEQKGTGGTFAERFHYLMLCLIAFGSSDHNKALFENSIHNEPTERFLERIGGGGGPRGHREPEWHKDGKCLSCGFDTTTDSNGNTICSNPMCMKHYASVSTGASASFRKGGRDDRGGTEPVDPNSVPVPPKEGGRNWKKKGDYRHNRDDGDERGFSRKGGKKRGPRFRDNDEDFDNEPQGEHAEGDKTVFASGFKNPTLGDAFAGLNLGGSESETAPAETAETLPEPPPEQPVV